MEIDRRRALGTLVALVPTWVVAADDDGYPSKPITLVVPFTPGSGTDVVARLLADPLARQLGQQLLIDNKAGAGGTLGAALVAAAAPDGYTLLVHSAGHVANAALYPKLKYDTLRDFTPVAMLATLPNVLVVAPASGIKTVAELVQRAKVQPGRMSYGSAGNGSATHINAEKFRIAAGVQATHVPYRGTPPALTDVVGGQIDWFFAPLVSALPLIADQRLVALAVSSPQRSAALPNVPTTLEAGFPGSDYTFWVGLFAPAKTPPGVLARLARETAKALQLPEIRSGYDRLGAESPGLTQAQFAELVVQETASTGALIRQAGIKTE